MVVAEDVVSYFQSLKSYERIWIMCKLQHSCLPFELRFLGTCLEELGRRDFNHLRPVENEANSNAEINIAELRKISDKDVQSKIILYLSLLHSHNYSCSNSLYKILCDSNEVNTFLKYEDEGNNSFEQLLMIYTLAVNHPAFSCEQKQVLHTIFNEIQVQEGKRSNFKNTVPQTNVEQTDSPSFASTIQVQECQSQINTSSENTVIAQSLPNPSHISTIPPPYTAHDLSIPVHEQIGILPAHSFVRFLPPSWNGATAIPGVGIVLTTTDQTTTTHTPFLSRSSSPSISNAPSRSSSPSTKVRPLSAPFVRSPQLTGILPPQPASLPLSQTTVDPFVEMINKDSSPLPANAPTYPSEQLYRRSDEELTAIGMTEDNIQSLRCMVVNNKRLSSDDSLSTPSSVDKVAPNDTGTEALKEFIEKSVPTSYNVYTAAGIPGAVDPSVAPYPVPQPYVCVYCNPNNVNGFVSPANPAEISCLDHDMNLLRLEADVPSRNSNGSNSDTTSSDQSSPPNTPLLPQNNLNKRSNKHNASNEYSVNNNHNNNNNNSNNNNIDERSNAGDSSSEERHSAHQTSYQARGRIINNRGRSKNQNSFTRGRGTHRRRNENMNGNNEEVKKPNFSNASAEGTSFQYSTNPIAAVTNATTYVHPPQYLRCYNTFPTNSFMRAPSHHHPFTSNEVMYHQYPPPQPIFPGAIPYTQVVLPTKISCYNCGSQTHYANDCRDSTLEELNKNGQYRLDFTPVEGTLEK